MRYRTCTPRLSRVFSSVMAAAASSGIPLVSQGQRLAILPAVYGIDDLREAITNYDTIVLMETDQNLMAGPGEP